MNQWEELVLKSLSHHLSARLVTKPKTDADFELRLDDGRHLVVQVKSTPALRRDDLLGRLALQTLSLRKLDLTSKMIPVAAIVVPNITKGAVEDIQEFAREHAKDIGWALVGRDGSLRLHAPGGLDVDARVQSSRARREESLPLFRDLHEWLLKVLLLRGSKPPLWSGPDAELRSVADLASRANVSANTASRFVRAFIAADFLRSTPTGFQIVRRAELLRAWVAHIQRQTIRRVPVRSLYGSPPSLESIRSKKPWALSGFAACEKLGVLHATHGLSEIYVHDVDAALHDWELSECEQANAHFVLLPRRSESVFRATTIIGQVPVVDVLQAALDVSVHPARGKEQADFIFNDVLRWTDA